MVHEAKEWTRASRRLKDSQSGGVHLFINLETLKFANIPNNKSLMVRQHPCKNGRIILRFKEGD